MKTICTICGAQHSETNERFPTLCKVCRAEVIAQDSMASRLADSGVEEELCIIKKQHEKLGRRVARLCAIIASVKRG